MSFVMANLPTKQKTTKKFDNKREITYHALTINDRGNSRLFKLKEP